MTTTLHTPTQTACRAVFITTLLVFLALAAALVVVQLAGVLLLRPEWITWASATLLVPSITTAVVFGLTGFVNGYLVPAETTGAEEGPS
ncbi:MULTISPECIES: hypothetical protein [Actinopolyspora]|uniref:hypothetical protein n=1 Tax=Actinopolyspora TaxID=1849 RepID=UPI00036BF021|nr:MULTISPECIES: hypothetical protein [Actinopolyspora]NHD19521.1 hypothetical protein [Actinopolyspora sp. BKK2]NHE78677.1 hypothetical protein [Actinopolyspora sp. BKK1]